MWNKIVFCSGVLLPFTVKGHEVQLEYLKDGKSSEAAYVARFDSRVSYTRSRLQGSFDDMINDYKSLVNQEGAKGRLTAKLRLSSRQYMRLVIPIRPEVGLPISVDDILLKPIRNNIALKPKIREEKVKIGYKIRIEFELRKPRDPNLIGFTQTRILNFDFAENKYVIVKNNTACSQQRIIEVPQMLFNCFRYQAQNGFVKRLYDKSKKPEVKVSLRFMTSNGIIKLTNFYQKKSEMPEPYSALLGKLK